MEKQKTNIAYGNGYINVYLPREDGVTHSDVGTPSPIFTIDSIYKFSDQVLNDRHLFIAKKNLHPTQFDCDEGNSIELFSERSTSTAMPERDSHLKTIKLSLDASRQGQTIRSRRRFNERLSAYMSSNRKTAEHVKLKEYSKSARTPRVQRESKVEKVKKNIPNPVISLGTPGRGTSSEKKVHSVELPPLQTSRTILTRQKSYFGKEDTFWFPSSALRGIEPKQNQPIRPSSRQFDIWRQSTELLLDNQIERFSPARLSWPQHIHNDIYITQKTFV